MGESTFEFSVNEYSWQPKVNILVFSFLSNLTPGSKVSAPEELEPYLRMLHGKQSKNLIRLLRITESLLQGGRTVRYAIYVNGQEVENGTEPSTGGSIQGLPAGIHSLQTFPFKCLPCLLLKDVILR